MNLPCLYLEMISGAAGGNLACARFEKCKMGMVVDSLLGALGGFFGGQIFLQFFASDFSPSEMQFFLSSVVGGALGGAVLTAMIGSIRAVLKRRGS